MRRVRVPRRTRRPNRSSSRRAAGCNGFRLDVPIHEPGLPVRDHLRHDELDEHGRCRGLPFPDVNGPFHASSTEELGPLASSGALPDTMSMSCRPAMSTADAQRSCVAGTGQATRTNDSRPPRAPPLRPPDQCLPPQRPTPLRSFRPTGPSGSAPRFHQARPDGLLAKQFDVSVRRSGRSKSPLPAHRDGKCPVWVGASTTNATEENGYLASLVEVPFHPWPPGPPLRVTERSAAAWPRTDGLRYARRRCPSRSGFSTLYSHPSARAGVEYPFVQ